MTPAELLGMIEEFHAIFDAVFPDVEEVVPSPQDYGDYWNRPDEMTLRLSELDAEAEAEMAEWDRILHPKRS